jgi:hypothetical protein
MTTSEAGASVQCQHLATHEGARVALRYGSSATEVCDFCGQWRTLIHKPGPWQPLPIPPESELE